MDNLNRHKKTCKLKEDIYNQNEELKVKIKQQEEQILEIAELKKMVADLLNSKLNTKNNNSNNTNNNNHTTNNNTTNNNNNGTINNNYITIVPFGKEKFVEVSTEKEQLFILQQKGNDVLYKCIEMKHFNEKYPQFHNYVKTNNRTDEAKIFDEDVGDFKIVDNNVIVDDVISFAECDIENMYVLHENKINNKQKDNINKILDSSIPHSPYKLNTVKAMPYDHRNKVLETHKRNRKYKSIK